jgi:site-specific recombinase XerD
MKRRKHNKLKAAIKISYLPLLDSYTQYISTKKSNKNDIRSRLRGNYSKRRIPEEPSEYHCGALRYMMERMGLISTKDIKKADLQEYNEGIWDSTVKQTARNNKLSALRCYLEWAIEQGHVDLKFEDVRELELREYIPEKPELPPEQFTIALLESLRKRRYVLGDNVFMQLRNYLMFAFAASINGIRPSVEILRIDLSDVDENKCELTVTRKRSKKGALRRQTICFRKDFVRIIKRYKRVRQYMLNNCEDKYKAVDKGQEAFFIKTCPSKMGVSNQESSWRLESGGFRLSFNEMANRLGYPGIRPYLLRHASITMQVAHSRFVGLDVAETAFRNDHDEDVCLQSYNDIVRILVEYLTRSGSELSEFVQGVLAGNLLKFLRDPSQIGNLAGSVVAFMQLGQLKLIESIKEYRAKIDSGNSFCCKDDLKALSSYLNNSGKSSEMGNIWTEVLGRNILKYFSTK